MKQIAEEWDKDWESSIISANSSGLGQHEFGLEIIDCKPLLPSDSVYAVVGRVAAVNIVSQGAFVDDIVLATTNEAVSIGQKIIVDDWRCVLAPHGYFADDLYRFIERQAQAWYMLVERCPCRENEAVVILAEGDIETPDSFTIALMEVAKKCKAIPFVRNDWQAVLDDNIGELPVTVVIHQGHKPLINLLRSSHGEVPVRLVLTEKAISMLDETFLAYLSRSNLDLHICHWRLLAHQRPRQFSEMLIQASRFFEQRSERVSGTAHEDRLLQYFRGLE